MNRAGAARKLWQGGHCVIAPDKFKGSLTAPEVAAHLAAGLRQVRPDIPVVTMPVADGGDGTVDAVVESGFSRLLTTVTGPLGDRVVASFAIRDHTAVVELAEASGLRRLRGKPDATVALAASSLGTGELIKAAVERGASRVVLGLGGSASTDGGAGMLTALGVRLLDEHGHPLAPGGGSLRRLARIDAGAMIRVPVTVASDVDNPLLGVRGAANVYARQKGAETADIDELERGLAHFESIVRRDLRVDVVDRPGAGAAGGVGYAALAFLGAQVRPGIELMLEQLGFAEQVEGARLVITGEGSLDRQTLHGKAPVGVARAAAAAGAPVIAVAGQRALTDEQLRRARIEQAYALTDIEPDPEICMAQAGPLLEVLARNIAENWLGDKAISNEAGAHA
ncbi:glycerate kinase [Nocardia sp. NPDC051463]|uniref:glycerate kinase n=1 Tax=Nocardia sp. NPDC051463 TaxID=3154845 RepID=UPI00344F524C